MTKVKIRQSTRVKRAAPSVSDLGWMVLMHIVDE